VLAETGVVAVAEIEGLASVGWPLVLVVECGGVPDNLEHELWDLHRVGRWAGASVSEEVLRAGGGCINT